jgi:hypothetical protein
LALPSLASAFGPTAELAVPKEPPLASAFGPQAKPELPAVAPPPVCGSFPSRLPPQTNCAAAGDAQRHTEIAIAKTNENLVDVVLDDIRPPFRGPNVENSDLPIAQLPGRPKELPGRPRNRTSAHLNG